MPHHAPDITGGRVCFPQGADWPCGKQTRPPKVHLTVMFASPVLAGQTAIVTGGGTGIGLAVARALGKLGATVAIASRNADHLNAGAEALRSDGTRVLTATVDVRDSAQV